MKSLIIVLVTAILCGSVWASKCTDICDLQFLVSPTTVICATDNNTYRPPLSAIVGLPPPLSCYRKCGLAVLYPGPCGCPNDCGRASHRGKCSDSSCVCADGWGGTDCNTIKCPNSCSNHGNCNSRKGPDVCNCDDGYTGIDCSIPTLDIPLLPYGEITALNNKPYYMDDQYGDHHPIFNISVIANWYVEMDPDDLHDMLQPENTWNMSRQDVKVYFNNGNIHQKVHKTGMKLKGHFARLGVKKSFSLKIKDDFFNIQGLVLKAASLDGSYLKNQISVEYLRSMMVPSVRASFATLTINGIFWGLYWMTEEMDESFVQSRIGNTKGNFYGMSHYLNYLGPDVEPYQNCSMARLGNIYCYSQDFGDGNWTDVIDFARFVNQSTDAEFQSQIGQLLDMDNFLRTMVVLSAIDDVDTYTTNGNNWGFYSDPDANIWRFFGKDYEFAMLNPFRNVKDTVEKNEKAQIAYRIMQIPAYQEMFNAYYQSFLDGCLSPKLENSTLGRINAFEKFLLPIVKTDRFFHITFGLPVTDFLWEGIVHELKLFLELRYHNLRSQFKNK